MDKEVGGGGSLKSEINVTPLVDVCLVLLIIFMVVTPLLGNPRELPETDNPERMPQSAKQLDMVIEQDGRVFVSDTWIREDDLLLALRKVHDTSPERHVVIKADRRLRFAQVRMVMRTLSEAGFSGAGLATQKKQRPAVQGQ